MFQRVPQHVPVDEAEKNEREGEDESGHTIQPANAIELRVQRVHLLSLHMHPTIDLGHHTAPPTAVASGRAAGLAGCRLSVDQR